MSMLAIGYKNQWGEFNRRATATRATGYNAPPAIRGCMESLVVQKADSSRKKGFVILSLRRI